MPTKTKIDPDQLYACNESFAGVGFAARFGQLFPGSHEFVQRWPDRFTPDGELLEQPDPRREATPLEARHYAEHVERHKSTPISPADVVTCTQTFSLSDASPEDVKRLGLTDVTIPAGAKFHRFSPLVQLAQYADRFEQAGR
jgi:hypothetical protein